jgi:hypothetical protein
MDRNLREMEIDELKRARPYLRSVLAFLVYLRFGPGLEPHPFIDCYEAADHFLMVLRNDLRTEAEESE